jgi:hypothetical protein
MRVPFDCIKNNSRSFGSAEKRFVQDDNQKKQIRVPGSAALGAGFRLCSEQPQVLRLAALAQDGSFSGRVAEDGSFGEKGAQDGK